MSGNVPYEPGPWERHEGIIRSATTHRPVAEVVRSSDTSQDGALATWRANERLIVVAPEMVDALREFIRLYRFRFEHFVGRHAAATQSERTTLTTASRLLNGVGRLQVQHEMEGGKLYVRVLVTERRCHIVLDDGVTLCKRPFPKDDGGAEFVRRVTWQAACELYDCEGCRAFMPMVEL